MTTNWIKPDEPGPPQQKFELALDQDEIYAESGKKGKSATEAAAAPVSAPQPAPKVASAAGPSPSAEAAAPPVPASPPAPVPAGPPGLLLARRRQSATQKLMSHPIIWPSVGALAALLVGFLAAFWVSGTLLTSNVKPLVTERAILLKTPVEQRDTPRIQGIDAKIAAARSSVAWKCGGLWTLVFAAGLFTWSRLFKD